MNISAFVNIFKRINYLNNHFKRALTLLVYLITCAGGPGSEKQVKLSDSLKILNPKAPPVKGD